MSSSLTGASPTRPFLWICGSGALFLLFGMLVSRIMKLSKDDVIEDGQATCLSVDGYRFTLPPRLAVLVSQLSDQGRAALD